MIATIDSGVSNLGSVQVAFLQRVLVSEWDWLVWPFQMCPSSTDCCRTCGLRRGVMPDRKLPATDREAVEGAVRDCYSTWSAHYYDDYYRGAGAYPPLHTDIVCGLLRAAGARTVLDAGCGPASMLRDLAEPGLEQLGLRSDARNGGRGAPSAG